MIQNNSDFEWISPSEMAKRVGVSVQTIYNRVHNDEYETMRFARGEYCGILIKTKVLKNEQTETRL